MKLKTAEDLSKLSYDHSKLTIKECSLGYYLDYKLNKCKHLKLPKCSKQCFPGFSVVPGLCQCLPISFCNIYKCQPNYILKGCKCIKKPKSKNKSNKLEGNIKNKSISMSN